MGHSISNRQIVGIKLSRCLKTLVRSFISRYNEDFFHAINKGLPKKEN